ncbi:Fukutin [Nymphon striatum]|nr:Fukutin [Nymphon striatum]
MLDQMFRLVTSNITLHTNTNKIRLEKGVRQGDSISPNIFTACLENVCWCLNWTSKGINSDRLTNLRFADDVVLFSESPQELQLMVEELRTASGKVGLEINLSKTKAMFNRNVEIQPIMTRNVALDQVDRYTYLGQLISVHRDWEPEDFKEDQNEIEHTTKQENQNFTSEFDLIRNITKLFRSIDAIIILAEPRILQKFISPPVKTIPVTFETVLFKNDLILGRHAGSVDWYGHYIIREDVIVPKYFLNFLSQLRFSRYVNCNKTTADQFAKAHQNESKRNPSFERTFKIHLKELKRITKIMGIPFWIMSGTTLGWVRQCGLIGYTQDIDIGIWATDISNGFEYLLKSSKLLKPQWRFGSVDYGYVIRAGIYVDLYFLYQDANDSTWIGVYDPQSRSMYRSTFPMVTLCSTEMLNTRILVPCNAEAMVIAEYGNNWNQPKEKYDYLKDATNMKFFKKYNVNEWESIRKLH